MAQMHSIRSNVSKSHVSFRCFLTNNVYTENHLSSSYSTSPPRTIESPISVLPFPSSPPPLLAGSLCHPYSHQRRGFSYPSTGSRRHSSRPSIASILRETKVYNSSMSNPSSSRRSESPHVNVAPMPEFHALHTSFDYRAFEKNTNNIVPSRPYDLSGNPSDINRRTDPEPTEASSTLALWPSPSENIYCAEKPNRIIMLASSINDHTKWPIWKHMQMRKAADELHKKKKQPMDWVMLAFQDTGAFEARVSYHTDDTGGVMGEPHHQFNILSNMTTFCPELLKEFLDRWHLPGKTYFVYGGHGMGDYLELEQNKITLQCHQLADIMGQNKYEAILMDACFMANLDNVYHLRKNTRYIGACEGYMWEPDNQLESHVFNTKGVVALTKAKDPLIALTAIGKNYTCKTMRGDFSILDTTHVEELYHHCQNVIIPRIYDRVNFFSEEKQDALKQLAEDAMREGDPEEVSLTNPLFLEKELKSEDVNTKSDKAAARRAEVLRKAIQYEHSLYPSEVEDKQICDLYEYLADVVREELYGSDGAMAVREELDSRRPTHEKQPGEELVAHVNPLETIVSIDDDTIDAKGHYCENTNKYRSAAASVCPDSQYNSCGFIIPPRTLSPIMQGQPLSQDSYIQQTTEVTHTVLSTQGTGRGDSSNPNRSTSKAHKALSLFHKVVVNYFPPKDTRVYATILHGLSIVAPELSKDSKTLRRTNYHRQAFKRKAKEFLSKSKSGK